MATVGNFMVQRDGGVFGEVSVDFVITRNGSGADPVAEDLSPAGGTVTLAEGQRSQSLLISLVDSPVPEEVEEFVISLIGDSVTGGATLGAVTWGYLTIRDSDDAYGVVQFSSDTEQRIASDGGQRRLQLVLTRAAGLVGRVAVTYSAVYRLPDQGTGDASSTGEYLYSLVTHMKVFSL